MKPLKKLNPIAYWLDLPIDLEHEHNEFRISQIRNYVPDPNQAIITEPIEVTQDLVYKEHPV